MGKISKSKALLMARKPFNVKMGRAKRAKTANSAAATISAQVPQSGRQGNTRPLGPVPQASIDDVVRTLGGPRFKLFGFAFGPKKQVTDVQLRTDASGNAFGAFARVNGRRVTIDGDLFARLVDRQFAQIAQIAAKQDPAAALKKGAASAETPALRPASPNAVRQPLARPSRAPIGPRPSPVASPALQPTWTPSSQSLTTLASFFGSNQEVDQLTPQTSVSSVSEAVAPLTAAQKRAWMTYCTNALNPKIYASDAEVFSVAQMTQRKIRVISTYQNIKGTPTFYVTDVSPLGLQDAPTMTLLLSGKHYSAITGDIAAFPELSKDALHELSSGSPQAATAAHARLTASSMLTPVPMDGACFYHCVAVFTGLDPAKLRADTVQFMRDNGDKLLVPDGFGTEALLGTLSSGQTDAIEY